eukprot:35889-Eustigmatos_ZCMA.PRE.1
MHKSFARQQGITLTEGIWRSTCTILRYVPLWSAASNGGYPTKNSYSSTPSDHTSTASSWGLPCARQCGRTSAYVKLEGGRQHWFDTGVELKDGCGEM